MAKLSIIFAGSGEFGTPTLRRLLDMPEFAVVTVVTQPDRPAGRGRKLTPAPIGKLAGERGLPVIKTANINAESLPPADVMVVIAFGQKIAPYVVDHPRLGSVNLHGSRLPLYRGAAPVNWAVIDGQPVSGNSIIRLAPKMDAGAILAQSEVPIGELMTAGELHDLLAEDGARLVPAVIAQLRDGTAREAVQDDSRATLARKLGRADAVVDWSRDATQIANQIRGMYPWPGCHVRLVDASGTEMSRVALVRARRAFETSVESPPGTILADGAVAAGSGAVEIVELQPEGKRPMSLDAFRNGHRWEPGMRLESIT